MIGDSWCRNIRYYEIDKFVLDYDDFDFIGLRALKINSSGSIEEFYEDSGEKIRGLAQYHGSVVVYGGPMFGFRGYVKVIDINHATELFEARKLNGFVYAVAADWNHRLFAAGTSKGTIYLWQTQPPQLGSSMPVSSPSSAPN